MTFYKHWRDVPASAWRWPNFSPREIACRGTGELRVNAEAMDKLQALRNRLGRPLIITSAYRSAKHNAAVGGAKASQHLTGSAFDVVMANHEPSGFEAAARAVGFTGFGYYPKQGFMHVDIGPRRSWGTPFPKGAPTGLPKEPELPPSASAAPPPKPASPGKPTGARAPSIVSWIVGALAVAAAGYALFQLVGG